MSIKTVENMKKCQMLVYMALLWPVVLAGNHSLKIYWKQAYIEAGFQATGLKIDGNYCVFHGLSNGVSFIFLSMLVQKI